MTALEQLLAEAQSLCDAATPGPWTVYSEPLPLTEAGRRECPDFIAFERRIGTTRAHPQLQGPAPVVSTSHSPYIGTGTHIYMSSEDAAFIARARTLIPELVAALRVVPPATEDLSQ